MRLWFVRSLPVFVAAVIAAACGGTTTTELAAPSDTGKCQLSLTTPLAPATAAQLSVPLVTTRECVWTVQPDAAWIEVQPSTGQGATTLAVTVAENPTGRARSAAIVINDDRFSLTQEAAPCRFAITPRTAPVPHHGGRIIVEVTTLDGCSWSARSSQPWMRVVAGSGSESSGVAELQVDSNLEEERTAQLTIADLVLVVTQSKAPGDRTACRFSVTIGSANFTAAGGEGLVRLHSLPGCAWHAASSEVWIVITSSSNAIGTDDIRYRVEPNTSSAQRQGVIVAGGRTHIVRQSR